MTKKILRAIESDDKEGTPQYVGFSIMIIRKCYGLIDIKILFFFFFGSKRGYN